MKPDIINDDHKYITRATEEAAIEVASTLLPADRSEVVDGHGLDPLTCLKELVLEPETVQFIVPNGKAAGMAGVSEGGRIWMLCTSAIQDYPLTFAREAKRFVERRTEPLLWNFVDKRNTTHLKLLKFLGFKFLRQFEYGPNNLTFIEFCKINYEFDT